MNGTAEFALPTQSPVMMFSDVSVLEAYVNKCKRETECMIPAQVVKYDRTTHKADVRPLVAPGIGTGKYVPPAVLTEIPVLRLQFGGYLIDAPLYPGDTGWLLGADRDTSGAMAVNSGYTGKPEADGTPKTENKGPAIVSTLMRHQYAYGTFVPAKWGDYKLETGDEDALIIAQINRDGTMNGGVKLYPDGRMDVGADAGLDVSANTKVHGDLQVSGDADMLGDASVRKDAVIHGSVVVGGKLEVDKSASIKGAVSVDGSESIKKNGKTIDLNPARDMQGGQFAHAKFREVSVVVGQSHRDKYDSTAVRLAVRKMMVLATGEKQETDVVIPLGGSPAVDNLSVDYNNKQQIQINEYATKPNESAAASLIATILAPNDGGDAQAALVERPAKAENATDYPEVKYREPGSCKLGQESVASILEDAQSQIGDEILMRHKGPNDQNFSLVCRPVGHIQGGGGITGSFSFVGDMKYDVSDHKLKQRIDTATFANGTVTVTYGSTNEPNPQNAQYDEITGGLAVAHSTVV